MTRDFASTGRVHLTMHESVTPSSEGAGQSIFSAPTRQARSRVTMLEVTAQKVATNSLKKGDVLAAARFAAVQAAKAAQHYLPLLDDQYSGAVAVDFEMGENFIDVRVGVRGEDILSTWMPALAAATAASLTIFDMCKAVDRTMSIGPIRLDESA